VLPPTASPPPPGKLRGKKAQEASKPRRRQLALAQAWVRCTASRGPGWQRASVVGRLGSPRFEPSESAERGLPLQPRRGPLRPLTCRRVRPSAAPWRSHGGEGSGRRSPVALGLALGEGGCLEASQAAHLRHTHRSPKLRGETYCGARAAGQGGGGALSEEGEAEEEFAAPMNGTDKVHPGYAGCSPCRRWACGGGFCWAEQRPPARQRGSSMVAAASGGAAPAAGA